MRRGNGEGSVIKLGGKRRKPYAVRITTGYTLEGKQQYKYLGYYEKKNDAKIALREFLVNPYNLNHTNTKLAYLFEEWAKTSDLAESTMKSYRTAFRQGSMLHNMNMRDIKAIHIEKAMEDMKPNIQGIFKNAMGHVYTYAIKHEIVDKDIMGLISVKSAEKVRDRKPFTVEEINKLREFKHPWNDTALILLYTGMRINEMLDIKTENVHLKERYMIGGKKTKAGQNRIIPLHDDIFDLVKARYGQGNKYLISNDKKQITYISYRKVYWDKMIKALNFDHIPHETRHTFTTFADRCGLNKVATKKIIGHALGDMTDHYTHKNVAELLAEVNKLKYQ